MSYLHSAPIMRSMFVEYSLNYFSLLIMHYYYYQLRATRAAILLTSIHILITIINRISLIVE